GTRTCHRGDRSRAHPARRVLSDHVDGRRHLAAGTGARGARGTDRRGAAGAARHAAAHRRRPVGTLTGAHVSEVVRNVLVAVAVLAVLAAAVVALVSAPWWLLAALLIVLIAWMALTRAGRQ